MNYDELRNLCHIMRVTVVPTNIGSHFHIERDEVRICVRENELHPKEFVLAHELSHATGVAHRLNRYSLDRYFRLCRTRYLGKRFTRTCVRVEKAICDRVGEALSLKRRGIASCYPPVVPGTRTAHYVQHHALRTLEFIINQMENAKCPTADTAESCSK